MVTLDTDTPSGRTLTDMARETSKRTSKRTTSKSDAHCAHCGQTAKLDTDGNVEPHDQASGISLCPGTGYPPLTEG